MNKNDLLVMFMKGLKKNMMECYDKNKEDRSNFESDLDKITLYYTENFMAAIQALPLFTEEQEASSLNSLYPH